MYHQLLFHVQALQACNWCLVRRPPSETTAATMNYKDEEATAADSPPDKLAVRREDSASTAAGHVRLELVDDKLGKFFF